MDAVRLCFYVVGDADEWVAEMKGRDKEYDFIHHFIVEDNQNPIGFVQ